MKFTYLALMLCLAQADDSDTEMPVARELSEEGEAPSRALGRSWGGRVLDGDRELGGTWSDRRVLGSTWSDRRELGYGWSDRRDLGYTWSDRRDLGKTWADRRLEEDSEQTFEQA